MESHRKFPLLQLALDFFGIEDAITISELLQDDVDIIEIGTPMLLQHGLHAIRRLKASLNVATVLADLKIIDAGFHEADMAFQSGADIVTVLGLASDTTVSEVLKAARQYEHRQVMADLIECRDVGLRSQQLIELGVDIICVHTAVDRQKSGDNPLQELQAVRQRCPNAMIAVAGGVSLKMAPNITVSRPAIVVVGSTITNNPDPLKITQQLQLAFKECL